MKTKRTLKTKLGITAAILALAVPLPVMAATQTFTNFTFTTAPREDKSQFVTSAAKAGDDAYETLWYYRITALSGVGTIASNKIFFLEPYRAGHGSIAIPATMHSGITLNASLNAPYYGTCPADETYSLYAISNTQYGSSMSATVSGRFTP
jgi:hypothetical protein